MNIKKPEQLARIVCGHPRFENTRGTIVMAVRRWDSPAGMPGWRLDRRLYSLDGQHSFDCITDCCLQPIDDKPGEDEMLGIAGKPRTEDLPSPCKPQRRVVPIIEHV